MTIKKTKSVEAEKFLTHLLGNPIGFGDMIRALRQCDEISQTELAKKMGVTRAYLCDIEKNRHVPTIALALKLAKVMGYSHDQFISMAIQDQLKKAGVKMKVELKVA